MTSPFEIRVGHCLELLADVPSESVDCCVTSPPYWGLRDYGDPGQAWPEVAYRPLPGMPEIVVPPVTWALGREREPYQYVAHLVTVFREVRRVLKPSGTLWLNLGDSYAGQAGGAQGASGQRASRTFTAQVPAKSADGLKPKDLTGLPWLVALALRTDGWYLRAENIWHKPNPLPAGAVRDRTTRAHEQVFHLSKSARYYYDADAVREPDAGKPAGNGFRGRQGGASYHVRSGGPGTSEPWQPGKGRNRRSVWTVPVACFPDAHFAVMPAGVVRLCVLVGCPPGGLVLDPFAGAGTTGLVAASEGRRFLGLEQSAEYATMAAKRIAAGERPRRTATSSPRTLPSPAVPASEPKQLVLPLAG